MIINYCEQGTPEWLLARSGIPTASEFSRIMTPGGKASSQADPYMNMLVAEWILGRPVENKTFGHMEYGKETEQQARDMYEMITCNEITEVGIVYTDASKLVGCSPDALLCTKPKGVEIKCTQPHVHVSYLLANGCPSTYIPQVQGSMYVTGYDEWDFMSFHPDFEPHIVTVKRDNAYIKNLHKYVQEFIGKMLKKRKLLEAYKREK